MSYLRIKELLKEKDVTAKDLAADLGIAENSLSRIITEKQQPRFELLQKIADLLDVQLWQLFSGSQDAVKGIIDYRGIIYPIQTKKDLEELLKNMQ